jgi:outer membrane protein assembly factor BamC
MMAEQGLSAGGKVSLQESPQGDAFIRLGLPFDRAWASLARALTKSSFEISDRDRSEGVYYARFLGIVEDDEEGWFDWMWGDDDNPFIDERFILQMRTIEPNVVAIEIRPEDNDLDFTRRAEQDLLNLIKGNIN